MRLESLILASASPRRAEILRAANWNFEVRAANIEETLRAGESASDYVERLARTKAEAIAVNLSNGIVIGADTTVVVDDEILGKPRDAEDARRMLRRLNNRWHEVLTGVALIDTRSRSVQVAHERTRVKFGEISEGEIEWYVSTDEPMDKAGAYAIQGRGALFIEAIDGDYWNVVGLPLRLVYNLTNQKNAEGGS
ncbi:MAG: Maf family protein [Pyrinomonadaceae bacterium]